MISDETKWVWGYMKKYPFFSYLTIIGSIIEIILFSLPALFVAKIIDLLLSGASQDTINDWLLLMVGVAVIQGIVFYVVATINEFLAHRVTTDMTRDLFISLQKRPLRYHDQVKLGDIMARATGDTRVVNIGLSPAFRIIGQIITAFIFAILVFLTINIRLTIFIIIAMPLFGFSIIRYGKRLEPMSFEVQRLFGEISIHSAETILAIRDVKSYGAENIITKKFEQLSQDHAKSVRKVGITAAYYYPGLIIAVLLGITTLVGIYFITIDLLEIAGLVAFVGLIAHLGWISRNLQWVSEFAAKTSASSRRLIKMLSTEIEETNYGEKALDPNNLDIEFSNVSFKYLADRENALDNINVRIGRGETIAIVGGPGSGKSTFTKLLLNLYEPDEGSILINGVRLGEFSREAFYSQIASIEQNVFLFSDTVKANISFGKPNASFEEIIEVAQLASADEFISELEQGYETEIGERGVRLSGGQKQRIGIARALLLNPLILIMDDASSSLDSETEYEIQNAIRNVLKTRTSIIATHRLKIISEADRVLVFHKGKILADGSHSQLIRTSAFYRRLYEGHYELPPIEQEFGD